MGLANSFNAPISFGKKFQIQKPRPSSPQHRPMATSKILPFICQKTTAQNKSTSAANDSPSQLQPPSLSTTPEGRAIRPQRFPAAGASPYVPIRHCRTPYRGIAPPVTVRNAVPVFSAPPLPPPSMRPSQVIPPRPVRVAPPVCIRQAVPVFSALPVRKEEPSTVIVPAVPQGSPARVGQTGNKNGEDGPEGRLEAVKLLEQLEI